MIASGNGAPDVCVNNLLRISRSEVPFSRMKGLNPGLIDRPQVMAEAEMQFDAETVIETYEPRVTINSINILPGDAVSGGFIVTADIKEKEE